ncbi:MAG TPA: acetate/propionate family kinase [Ktedonobacterales bacterium]
MSDEARILAINSGSSSLRFALYALGGPDVPGARERRVLSGLFQRIGQEAAALRIADEGGHALVEERLPLPDHAAAITRLTAWLAEAAPEHTPMGIGHRLVHGGPHHAHPARVTDALLAELRELVPLAPAHLPGALRAIEVLAQAYPALPQVACFDTAFHQTMPTVAKLLPLPRWLWDAGIRRFGFHGLSYEYIAGELAREGALPERVIVAHLGNGASMVALRQGRSIETTMGFTPNGGLMMSTRSGELDPGVPLYLLRERGLSAEALAELIERQSGLLGVSALSGDMRDVLASPDPRAAQAVALFCYTARKYIGALAAALGGLELLVFTGGIGEHAPEVRRQICAGLGFLGLALDDARNQGNQDVLSAEGSRVQIRRMATNEELMIARHTRAILNDTLASTNDTAPHGA